MNRVLHAMDRLLQVALVILMSVLVLSITWQVVSRYFLQDPSSWTEELARFALIWSGLLGAVYAYRTRAHVGIDLLAAKLTPFGRRRLEVVSATCVIVFAAAVIVVGGSNLVSLTARLKQISAALGIEMAWVYSILPICGAMLVLYALANITSAMNRSSASDEAAK